jgi:replicative DNA helicase
LTGIDGVDRKAGGFLPGELIILAARTGHGKTLFAEQIRRHACQRGMHTLFAQGEMRHEQLAARELGPRAGVSSWHIRQPKFLTTEEFARLNQELQKECGACQILYGLLTIGRIGAAARRMKREGSLSLLIIDYDELVEAQGRDKLEQLASVTEGAWSIAVSLGIPVILISQLRKSEAGSEGINS